LSAAAAEGHDGVVRALLAHGADADRLDRTGRTALYWAVFRRHREAVRVLIAHGAATGAIAYDIFDRPFSELELTLR
jgi:ankyrin repeat protein